MLDYLIHPSASIARGIENLLLTGENSRYFAIKAACEIVTRLISVTVFPLFLSIELTFVRFPKLIHAYIFKSYDPGRTSRTWDKVNKFALAILFSPLGVRSPDIVSGLFLKSPRIDRMVRPFGVEEQCGKKVDQIHYPNTIEELQNLVRAAHQEGKKISLIGAGMSQGPQTVPSDEHSLIINMKHFNEMTFGEIDSTVSVGAGATWEQIQLEADKRGKSVIVKQASDIFSVGGSIGINCHGWAHEYGALASTVESLDIIDANGDLKTLTPNDELFGCMFGTFGYFGIVVSAKLKLVNNEFLIEKTTKVDLDDFVEHYKNHIKDCDIPLFGGRLSLDNLQGNPLNEVYCVCYEKVEVPSEETLPFIEPEPKMGTRIQRIGLQALSHLSYFTTRRLISSFWHSEKDAMMSQKKMTRNEALHPPINSFKMLHKSNLYAQWLQEYFITEADLPNFLRFLGAELKANDVRLINATIRPTPKDDISLLPYAEQDRYAVVICFSQIKTEKEIERTKQWIQTVNRYVISNGDRYYQAYMPFATPKEFEDCYGKECLDNLRKLKQKYDPAHVFSNGHTKKYFA